MRGRTRLGLIAGAVAIAVIGFIIAQSGGSDKTDKTTSTGKTATTTATTTPIQVVNGKPVGGIRKINVNKGEQVRFSVTSDVSDEVHVHGYDFMKDVKAGGTVRFDFPAKIDGSFEIELENRKEQIAALEVQP
jgi:heme/copper-type cytochrome/quinol oxidase subunit 2